MFAHSEVHQDSSALQSASCVWSGVTERDRRENFGEGREDRRGRGDKEK